MKQLGHITQHEEIQTDIYFGRHTDDHIVDWLSKSNYSPSKITIISHPFLLDHYSESLIKALKRVTPHIQTIAIQPGEASKCFRVVESIISQLLDQQLERRDLLISLGGGVLGDLTGFVASIYLRGISFINIPTTLLAQVDAAIGGKTGINNQQGKNLIGSFYQPLGTWINTHYLSTLDKRDVKSGLAEVIKYGVIDQPDIIAKIRDNEPNIQSFDVAQQPSVWADLIQASACSKINIVNDDVKESGRRALLNYGHTIGHGIETATIYGTYTHGEAIAMGMISATYIAWKLGICSKSMFDDIESLIDRLGYPRPNALPTEAIIQSMKHDKKNKGGVFHFILPSTIGSASVYPVKDLRLITEAINILSA